MSRRSRIKIALTTINAIKKAVVKTFGYPVNNTPSCQKLSLSIYEKTGHILNYNTLRRFFGLLPNSQAQINNSSLTILANYCGYGNLQHFSELREDLAVSDLHHFSNYLLDKQNIDFEFVNDVCEKYYKYNELYQFIDKCIFLAHLKNDTGFLKRVFELSRIFDLRKHNKHFIYHLIQNYAFVLRQRPKQIVVISKAIAKNANARKYYFEWFVDINNLCNSYDFALTEYAKYEPSSDAKIFNLNLQILKAFLKKDTYSLKSNSALLSAEIKYFSRLHPILKGRCFASKIFLNYYSKENNILKIGKEIKREIVNFETKNNASADLQLFLIFILQAMQFCCYKKEMANIIKYLNKKLLNVTEHWTKDALNHLNIYFAQSKFYENKIEEGMEILNQVDSTKFPLFESKIQAISYNLTLMDYEIKIENNKEVEKLSKEIKSIAKDCGYTFWS